MRSLFHRLIPVVLIAAAGCGSSELHTLGGKVAVQDAAGFAFSGDVLELRLAADPLQRAFGEIQSDGSFDIETLQDGKISRGLRPGLYEGRLVFSDDDPQHRKRAAQAIHRKFTRFETSAIKVQVPSPDVVVEVSAK